MIVRGALGLMFKMTLLIGVLLLACPVWLIHILPSQRDPSAAYDNPQRVSLEALRLEWSRDDTDNFVIETVDDGKHNAWLVADVHQWTNVTLYERGGPYLCIQVIDGRGSATWWRMETRTGDAQDSPETMVRAQRLPHAPLLAPLAVITSEHPVFEDAQRR